MANGVECREGEASLAVTGRPAARESAEEPWRPISTTASP
jgi:hypothetical protein